MKKAFQFDGYFTYICEADSLEEAEEIMREEMDEVLYDYRVERTY